MYEKQKYIGFLFSIGKKTKCFHRALAGVCPVYLITVYILHENMNEDNENTWRKLALFTGIRTEMENSLLPLILKMLPLTQKGGF
jgi:hypothetical protein